MHLKSGGIASRWLASPHALAVRELLHQALIVCVNKQRPILRTIVIHQAVDPVDGLGTKLDPPAPNEDGGVDLERQIGVELPYSGATPGTGGAHSVFQPRFWMMKLKNALEVGKPHSGTNERLNSDSL